ncbi:hypothetical protein AU252_09220 [Pseudarthrobacter sulfonivorans]|uniref:Uncharacterized protein n=1 Tax=Pseudarthrobacter sulfonivorans TaxID=121292 RepID=A0A0U3QWT0_9MICC|nr:hypothetical protein [Pseudarthrobacter sulfonivorans]ALV41308.1 hypothetical protein AU252_09220 [Pseudarthrobacter sulfonivorans]
MSKNPSSKSQTSFGPQNWSGLDASDDVQVVSSDGHSYAAVIDAKTADSSVVWIRRRDIGTRHMLEHHDGILIVPGP